MNTVVVVAVVVLVVVVVYVHQLISDAGSELGHRLPRWTPSTPASRALNNESRQDINVGLHCRELRRLLDSQQVYYMVIILRN